MDDSLAASRVSRTTLLDAAIGYARERHWDVAPGTSLRDEGAARVCSCGRASCNAPGAHPLHHDWAAQASAGTAIVRRWWEEDPGRSILLPTGRSFDVIDVPEQAGCLALARLDRMGLPLGPVIATASRRVQFFVLPGAREKMPDMLRRLGWGHSPIDLLCRGDGDFVIAPPSRMGTGGHATWAREPTEVNRWLPEAQEIVSPIAYACGRAMADA